MDETWQPQTCGRICSREWGSQRAVQKFSELQSKDPGGQGLEVPGTCHQHPWTGRCPWFPPCRPPLAPAQRPHSGRALHVSTVVLKEASDPHLGIPFTRTHSGHTGQRGHQSEEGPSPSQGVWWKDGIGSRREHLGSLSRNQVAEREGCRLEPGPRRDGDLPERLLRGLF